MNKNTLLLLHNQTFYSLCKKTIDSLELAWYNGLVNNKERKALTQGRKVFIMANFSAEFKTIQRQIDETLAAGFRLKKGEYNLYTKHMEMSREDKEELEGLAWDEYFAEYPDEDAQAELDKLVADYLRLNDSELQGILAGFLLVNTKESLEVLSVGYGETSRYAVPDEGLRYVFWELFFALTDIV